MNWRLIFKDPTVRVKGTHYREFKEHLAEEGGHQCVYCAISEAQFGGIWNFHVEHYRPKSQFQALIHSLPNLYYACAICNVFKGDDWPNEPLVDLSIHCYPEPSTIDYSTLFKLREDSGVLEGLTPASRYVVERIYLNRPQLVMERRGAILRDRVKAHVEFARRQFLPIKKVLLSGETSPSKTKLTQAWLNYSEALRSAQDALDRSQTARPYNKADVSRKQIKGSRKGVRKTARK